MVCPGHLREILLELTNSNCTFYKKRWRLEQNHILNVIAWVYNESIHGNIKWEILLFVKALHVDLFFPPSAFLVQIGTPNILKTAALAGPWTGRNSVNTVWKNYSNQRDPERCLLNSFMWSRRGMASSQLSKRLGKKTKLISFSCQEWFCLAFYSLHHEFNATLPYSATRLSMNTKWASRKETWAPMIPVREKGYLHPSKWFAYSREIWGPLYLT